MRFLSRFALVCIIALSGCDKAEEPPAEPKIVSEIPAKPYPDAVKVELSAQDRAYGPDAVEDKSKTKSWRKVLTADERKAIDATIVHRVYDPAPSVFAACCVPHHRLTYFDPSGKKIGEIDICFCCACIGAEPEIGASQAGSLEFKYEELKALIDKIGIPVDIDCTD